MTARARPGPRKRQPGVAIVHTEHVMTSSPSMRRHDLLTRLALHCTHFRNCDICVLYVAIYMLN